MFQKKRDVVHWASAHASVDGEGEAMELVLRFKMRDVRSARPQGKDRDSVGLAMLPTSFDLPEGSFSISSNWLQITAR